jgi:hypothetical protein
MKTSHATDEQLQQYAINADELPAHVRDHILTCAACLNSATSYRALFTSVHDQNPPRFDFDLESLVMQRLENRRQSKYHGPVSIAAMPVAAVLVIIIALTMFSTVFTDIFNTLSVWTIYLIATVTIIFLIANLIEMHTRYKRKITLIEEY